MEFEALREIMVKEQIITRGIKDELVIWAMSKVPRHLFVPPEHQSSAYRDHPLPIGHGQTISQPYIVALMTQCLELNEKKIVLEIGTGSGYQTALLAEISREVYSLERISALAEKGGMILKELNYKNIHLKTADGTLGWAECAPYDAIIVTAAAPKIPPKLLEQLKENGRLVIPMGETFAQTLTLVEKKGNDFSYTDVCGCVFVPLLGEQGYQEKKA